MKTLKDFINEAADEVKGPLKELQEKLDKYHGALSITFTPGVGSGFLINVDLQMMESMLFNVNRQVA